MGAYAISNWRIIESWLYIAHAFLGDVDIHNGLTPSRVLGAAGQKMADDEFVHTRLVSVQVGGVFGRVDGGMGLVGFGAVTRGRTVC